MNVKDVQLKSYVHHRTFFNWGRGVVLKVRVKDNLGYKTPSRFFVKWESDGKGTWCRASELRKTPRKVPDWMADRVRWKRERRAEDERRKRVQRAVEQGELFLIPQLEDDLDRGEPFHPNEFDGPGD